jgi:hypothetical protein
LEIRSDMTDVICIRSFLFLAFASMQLLGNDDSPRPFVMPRTDSEHLHCVIVCGLMLLARLNVLVAAWSSDVTF